MDEYAEAALTTQLTSEWRSVISDSCCVNVGHNRLHQCSSKNSPESSRNLSQSPGFLAKKNHKKTSLEILGKNSCFELLFLWSHRFQTETILYSKKFYENFETGVSEETLCVLRCFLLKNLILTYVSTIYLLCFSFFFYLTVYTKQVNCFFGP